MDPIYVTGHRNPDTDSIVSAMAYAALRNTLGDREYQAARLGHISDETQLVLDSFGFQPPVLISSMYTQVRDLEYDTPPALGAAVTVSRAWSVLQENGSLPGFLWPRMTGRCTVCFCRRILRSMTCRPSTSPGWTGCQYSTC